MTRPANSHSIVRGQNMSKPQEYRISYIKRMHAKIPEECPECTTQLVVDDETIYCPQCGLVTQTSIAYVAGHKFNLPHGLRLG